MSAETSLEIWFLHEELVLSLLPEHEITSLAQRLPGPNHPFAEAVRVVLFSRALSAYLARTDIAPLAVAHVRGDLDLGQLTWLEQGIAFKGLGPALAAIKRGGTGRATFSARLATDRNVRVHGEYNAARLTGSSAENMMSGTQWQFLLGYVQGVAADEIEIRPVVIAQRRLTAVPGLFTWAPDDPAWVSPSAVDQFAGVDFGQSLGRADLNVLKDIPEREVKNAFARILGEPEVPDDWGGEQFDLWTTTMMVEGRPQRAAIAFKGPAAFRPMTIAVLGKNGDQVDRLAQTAADLMVVQHCHAITAPVINMLKAYATSPRNPKRYMEGYRKPAHVGFCRSQSNCK